MTRLALAGALALFLCRCGGSTNPTTGGNSGGFEQTGGIGGAPAATDPNMVAVVVDPGPTGANYTNGLFATVTLCVPGSSTNCQTFDHLLVDTGSVGVRVLESELAPTLALPPVTTAAGDAVTECTPFVDGTAWGPVRRADVVISGELASNLPVQLIGEKSFLMPSSCTGSPITDFRTLAANGILGVGLFTQDCGSACAAPLPPASSPYYACRPGSTCSVASVPVADQVAHPVAAFPVDNNGTIIQLPSVAANGSPSVPGVLIFGIGTQANNGLGSATVLDLDARGFLGTTFPASGTTTYTSYLDSGSNGLFFLNSATTKLTQCTGGLSSFYCPASTANLAATIVGIGGVAQKAVTFSVANASRLPASAFAFANLAGPMPGFPTDKSVPGFDWGLPFYFGRAVFTAIEEKITPGGPGPFFAF